MKTKLFTGVIGVCLLLASCKEAGTLININEGNNPNIEVYKYYISSNKCIYIARFKDCPQVQTTTWRRLHGKVIETKSSIAIYENDSLNNRK